MVDITDRLVRIKAMIDAGKYFTINRGRQYGKTTTLTALERYLTSEYYVISLDFQNIGSAGFATEGEFVQAIIRLLMDKAEFDGLQIPAKAEQSFRDLARRSPDGKLDELFRAFKRWCAAAEKPLVLLIDEVDSASNNQVFLDFLAQLRLQYLEREKSSSYKTFQSVILAGVTDVRNLRRKLRPDEAHKVNSPWNIAADFNIDMSLSEPGIKGMLEDYEKDHGTGMDAAAVAKEIHSFTNGYPFLVSRICQLMDEQLLGGRFKSPSEVWTAAGVSEAVRRILENTNLLFDSIMGKVQSSEELRSILYRILFSGDRVGYNAYDPAISDAVMYGFVLNDGGKVVISNRIYETLLYNYFLGLEEMKASPIFHAGDSDRADFIRGGHLDMGKLLARYVTVFEDLYGQNPEPFSEEEGRRRFLLFVRPVINGTGNYYIEAETRDSKRMDLVIDYLGERHVIELKLWRGQAYNEEGEKQLADYLDACHLDKGYLLSYCFNKTKAPGLTRKKVNGKELVEALV